MAHFTGASVTRQAGVVSSLPVDTHAAGPGKRPGTGLHGGDVFKKDMYAGCTSVDALKTPDVCVSAVERPMPLARRESENIWLHVCTAATA